MRRVWLPERYVGPAEDVEEEYPIILMTGRLVIKFRAWD
ncbi:MAG: hypothetical protein K0R38_7471 [Polyangiaceae bacterium]|jgi:hypothetical protein|nr:hypothetical protein [Polyangiaceae bacterium]